MLQSDDHSESESSWENPCEVRQRASQNAQSSGRGIRAAAEDIQFMREGGQEHHLAKEMEAIFQGEDGERSRWTRNHLWRTDDDVEGDDLTENDGEHLQLQLLRELRFLREQVADKDAKNDMLQEKIATLTDNLVQTTEELEHRMALFSDAMARTERLEAQVGDAKKTLLSKEMQLHDLTQEKKTMQNELEGKEKERQHWEQEFIHVEEQLSNATRLNQQLQESHDARKQEVSAWKSKMKRALSTVDALKRQVDTQSQKEAELMQSLIQERSSGAEREQRWRAKNAKLELQLRAFEQELHESREAANQVQLDKREAQEDEVAWKSDVAAQQMEKQKQVVHLREKTNELATALEKAQVNEKLMQREIRRLREEVLLSESQRESEQRRVDQLVRGKEKEVAFIWQKYLDVMSPKTRPTRNL